MFNDLTTTLQLLHTRRSGKARDMVEPSPTAEQLRDILSAALRVPDHGKLNPWRFIVVPADKRLALADAIEKAYRAEKPDAGRLEIDAMRAYATQAPTLVIVLSCARENGRIPVWEQELSAGAVCQNLLIATHALGFVGNWLTGWPAYSNDVLKTLGGSDGDKIAGFMYLGSLDKPLDERPRPDYGAVVSVWN